MLKDREDCELNLSGSRKRPVNTVINIHKRQRITCVAEELQTSQKFLCPIELFCNMNCLQCDNINFNEWENPWFYVISCNAVSVSHNITYVFAERIVLSYWASVWTGHACLQATMQDLCVLVSLQRIQILLASHLKHFLSLVTTLICNHKMKWAHPVRVILAITVRCAPSTGIVLLVDLVHPIGALQVRGPKC